MAAEVVIKIKEAEEKADEIVKQATEQSRKLIADTQKAVSDRRKEFSVESANERTSIIEAAENEARKQSESLVAEGNRQVEKILNPEEKKLNSAVELIIERIVG